MLFGKSIKFGGKSIGCQQGDITEAEVDAIVNAANNHLWMGAGVAGAIKRKGGQTIEDEAVKHGPIKVGEAIATGAGSLKARHVIHAAVMGQDLRTNAELIREATVNSLMLADRLGSKSIAFPALGTGVGGFPIAECADIMIGASAKFIEKSTVLEKIVFVLFDRSGFEVFATRLEQLGGFTAH